MGVQSFHRADTATVLLSPRAVQAAQFKHRAAEQTQRAAGHRPLARKASSSQIVSVTAEGLGVEAEVLAISPRSPRENEPVETRIRKSSELHV